MKLEKIAKKFGTPTYVYDSSTIKNQYNKLKNAFDGLDVKLFYALKALNNINILKLIRKEGAGLDAVSIEEVLLGIRAGYQPNEIIYTPNCVDFNEIIEAVKIGVQINIDNLSILEQFGNKFGKNIPCCIRINPHIMAGGHRNISVGHIDSKFGISIHQVKHILRIVTNYKIKINGLHMHTGSDIVDADLFILGAELLYEVAKEFPDLVFIDLGSGFKISYKEDDLVTPINEIGKKIALSFRKFCENYGRNLELWFEPGKFLVSDSGKLLVKVSTVKQTTSTIFVGVNSGQNHLIRPMFYNAYHKIENISNPKGPLKLYSVVGYICESDTFGYDRMISEVREGDILAIHNVGAYGFSMSNNYNARLKPSEVLIQNENVFLIRKRETLSDLYKNEIEIDI